MSRTIMLNDRTTVNLHGKGAETKAKAPFPGHQILSLDQQCLGSEGQHLRGVEDELDSIHADWE
jgi:hypothetical protein